jgi:hypothetical protein
MARLAIGAVAGYAIMQWCGVFAALVSAGIGALLARFVIREDAGSLPGSQTRPGTAPSLPQDALPAPDPLSSP